jgi:fructose-1,6-bisphosphatase/inositol monophosphatase family enzyme
VFGSAALALAYLADGRFDSFIQLRGLSLWDIAAAGLIAQEAGATVTDIEGGPWFDVTRASRTSGIIAATAAHHMVLRELLR